MTSVAAPVPPAATVTSEPTGVLTKRVNARGLCTVAKLTSTDDPWFPATKVEIDLVVKARAACAGCPVIAECRELTLRIESTMPLTRVEGIFGALAPHERIALIRARRRAGGGTR